MLELVIGQPLSSWGWLLLSKIVDGILNLIPTSIVLVIAGIGIVVVVVLLISVIVPTSAVVVVAGVVVEVAIIILLFL